MKKKYFILALATHLVIIGICIYHIIYAKAAVLSIGIKQIPILLHQSGNSSNEIYIPWFLILCSACGSLTRLYMYLSNWKSASLIDFKFNDSKMGVLANIALPYLQLILLWAIIFGIFAKPDQINPVAVTKLDLVFLIPLAIAAVVLGLISDYIKTYANEIFH